MIRVMFVCLGNICRSPMAEFVFKDYVKKQGKEKEFYIESAATSSEEIGSPVHYGTVNKLREENIEMKPRVSRKLRRDDYDRFDFIIGMEERNIDNILGIVGDDSLNKVYRFLDFSDRPRNISDPYFTGNFDKTFIDIKEGVEAFYDYLVDNKYI